MANLSTEAEQLAGVINTRLKAIYAMLNGTQNNLNALNTSAKTNLVASINELKGLIDAIEVGDSFSGSYNDLTDKPSIPSTVAALSDRNTYDFTANSSISVALAAKAPLVSPSFTTPALGTPTSGNLANCTFPTLNQSTTGNAATATALATGRAINGVTFDGTAPITVTAAAGTLTGSTLAAGVTASSLTSLGIVTAGEWAATPISDTYISSAATWNAKGAADQVETYLVDDGIHSLTSASGVCTPDASNGRSQKFTLTENVTDFNTPTNLADGQSMTIGGIQDAVTPRAVTLDAAWKIYAGAASDIGSLAAGEGFELAIKRVGSEYRIWISTEQA